MRVSRKLEEYVESNILPLYENFDPGHRVDHARYVISRALKMAEKYGLDANMVYAAAAFHDVGIKYGRDRHEASGQQMFMDDQFMQDFFTNAEMLLVGRAIREHRASFYGDYTSLYSKVVSQADRTFDAEDAFRRALQYGVWEYPDFTKEQHYERVRARIVKKYRKDRCTCMIIDFEDDAKKLEELRAIAQDDVLIRQMFDKVFILEEEVE